MKIEVTSVMVDDQDKAASFYTDVLGFVTKVDIPAGGARWLTVVSPEQPDGVQLLLEPIGYEFAREYQRSLFDASIPCTMFFVDDIESEYARLRDRGVTFRGEPVKAQGGTMAVFEDTCGNLIGLMELETADG